MAYCESCGADKGRRQICPSCGKGPAPKPVVKELEKCEEKQPEGGLAIASLVIGVVAILGLVGNGATLIPAIVGLIISIMARKEAPDSSFAKAGFILNLLAVICGALILVFASTCLGCWFCSPLFFSSLPMINEEISYTVSIL